MRVAFPTGREVRGAKPAALVGALAIAAVAILVGALPAFAEHTRWWRQASFDDFEKGTANGVALRSDGKLFLGPRFAQFADAHLAYVLALRADSKGNLYAAGGPNATVMRLDASGKSMEVFKSSELAAQTLALDSAGNLYVGTSPDGKVYKVTPSGQSSVFFDPKTKYIWDLAMDRDGTLYVGTGDAGKIFAVAPDGKGQIFYASEETHIRALALDSSNVLAGTEPSGLILRIPKAAVPAAPSDHPGNSASNARHAFVLYETSKKEITALMPDEHGNLYVAAVGEKTLLPSPAEVRPQPAEPATPENFTIVIGPAGQASAPSMSAQATPFAPFPPVTSSSVYRIAADGSPQEIWSSRSDLVYALGLLPNGKLLLGTGNRGAVLELEDNRLFSLLVRTTSGQVTSIAAGPRGQLFLAAANPGKLFTMGPESEPEGTFESQPFDAHIFSRWGRVQWFGLGASASGEGISRIEFYARSGNTSNPQTNWSPWAGPYSNTLGDKLDCPSARFVQWKAVLHGTARGPTPELDWVSIAYLPKNIAPEVTGIALQDPGVRVQGIFFPGAARGSQSAVQLRMPQPAEATGSAFAATSIPNVGTPSSSHMESVPQGIAQKGFQSALWAAEDANDDQLEFAVYFRGENETQWKLLKDKLETRYYSWDTTAMPDGAYYLKIVASDAPSNPEGEGLSSERVSDRFEVDNTPPSIVQLTVDAGGADALRVRFQATDPSSSIARAQYSVDAGDWALVFPTGGLTDAPKESYTFPLQKLAPGEHTVTIRVYDQFENVATAEATFRVPGSGH